MFVKNNSGKSIRDYFYQKLEPYYDDKLISVFAEMIIWYRYGINRHEKSLFFDKTLTESDLLWWREATLRLKNKEPIQYVIGKVDFFGLELHVGEGVLIPRPETEELVDLITKSYPKQSKLKILDVGTGSGCIALALAAYFPEAELTGVDVSEQALAYAKKNSQSTGIKNIQWIPCDVLNKEFPEEDYDIVVSNPPYVLNSEKAEMQQHVVKFEPELALFVNHPDDLLFYKVIAEKAMLSKKNKDTVLYFEIHEDKGEELTEFFKDKYPDSNIELLKDLQGKDRFLRVGGT